MISRQSGFRLSMTAVAFAAAAGFFPRAAAGLDVVARVGQPGGRPVAGAVVYLAEHPQVKAAPPAEPYILDQINKEFVPHLLPIVVGGKVRFPNRDNIHHHVYSFSPPKEFELQLYKGEPAAPVQFDRVGVVKMGCNIHDWMSAVVLVLPNAHFAVTDSTGTARLTGLPDVPGLELRVFHERMRGSPEETGRALAAGGGGAAAAPVVWEISLKPERQKKRSAFNY